jgi:hypothetical protein
MGRHFHLDANAVEQRSADFGHVLLNLPRRAIAFLTRVGEVSARSSVLPTNTPLGNVASLDVAAR